MEILHPQQVFGVHQILRPSQPLTSGIKAEETTTTVTGISCEPWCAYKNHPDLLPGGDDHQFCLDVEEALYSPWPKLGQEGLFWPSSGIMGDEIFNPMVELGPPPNPFALTEQEDLFWPSAGLLGDHNSPSPFTPIQPSDLFCPSQRLQCPFSDKQDFILDHKPSTSTGLKALEEAFEDLEEIGKGAYGVVFCGRNRATGEEVALKRILTQDQKSILEAECLFTYRHPSIIDAKEIVVDHPDREFVYIVMELATANLVSILAQLGKSMLDERVIRQTIFQLLEGVAHLHDNLIIYGDLKPSNLLIGADERLKICDFGLSQRCSEGDDPYDIQYHCLPIGTLWYLAPELLTIKEYLTKGWYLAVVDMWAVDCIMAEMVCGEPLFPGEGDSQSNQYSKILDLLGPREEPQCFDKLRQRLPPECLSDSGFDLLAKLLAYDHQELRITAKDALHHPWFHS